MSLPAPIPGYALGLDVSVAQGTIIVPDLLAAGVDFLIAKATDGVGPDSDRCFADTCESCRITALPFGAYGVLSPSHPPIPQARFFCDTVRDVGRAFRWVALDFEEAFGESAAQALRSAVVWRDTVRAALGCEVIVYCAESFVDGLLRIAGANQDADADAKALATSPLWAADYGNGHPIDPRTRAPRIPHVWDRAAIWQVGPAGATLPGTRTVVDVDWFRGSVDELMALGR